MLSNALPYPDACLRGRTNKKLSPTLRKPLPPGSGRKIRRPIPGIQTGNTRKYSSRSIRIYDGLQVEPAPGGPAYQHIRQGCGEGFPEGGMAGNRSGRKPSRNVETWAPCQPFRSPAQRVIGRHSSRPDPQCRDDRRRISGTALGQVRHLL